MKQSFRFYLLGICLFTLLFFFVRLNLTTQAQTSPITRASVASNGSQANNDSDYAALSADGRFVVFNSRASNLVPNDTNSQRDVFVYDRLTAQTARVSVATDGSQGFRLSGEDAPPAISADGRHVVFSTRASNLAPGSTDLVGNLLIHDRDTDADGIYDEPGAIQTVRIAEGRPTDYSFTFKPALSASGRYVAFVSPFPLVPEDTNHYDDVYVHDRDADGDGQFDEPGETRYTLISLTHAGMSGDRYSGWDHVAITSDGRFVSFDSLATNLVPGDTNRELDVFVHDRDADGDGLYDELGAVSITRISVNGDGVQANQASGGGAMSDDGRFVTFTSQASDLGIQTTYGDCLVPGCRDVFVRDRDTDDDGIFDEPGAVVTLLVSESSNSIQANGHSYHPEISADGRYVTFSSEARNLVARDTNRYSDIYIHDLVTGETNLLSTTHTGAVANNDSFLPSISADGSTIAFYSKATNLVSGNMSNREHVFIHDRSVTTPPPLLATATPLPANTPIPPTAGTDWQVQTLDVRGLAGQYANIAIDPVSGDIHIVYYAAEGISGQLKYMTWDGVAWQSEVVDDTADVGQFSSLALDSSGFPRIAYYDETNNRLKHAAWNGINWIIEEVTTGATGTNSGWYASLTVDPFNVSHISFLDVVNGRLMYAKHAVGWLTQVVDESADVGWGTSLALDTDGIPHIAYYDRDNGDLKFASYQPATDTWNLAVLDSALDQGRYPSLAFDSNGQPHISYYDTTLDALKVAHHNGASWQTGYVNLAGQGGRHSSIFIDAFDLVRISYQGNGLMLAEAFGGTWDIETVDNAPGVGPHTSLVVDWNNQEHIVYYDQQYGDMKYVTMDANWQHHPVDVTTFNVRPSLAVYHTASAFSTLHDEPDTLHVNAWDGNTWTETLNTPVGGDNHDAQLQIDDNGQQHIVFLDESNGNLMYGTLNGSTWELESVTNLTSVNVVENILLLLDENNAPTIVFAQWDAVDNQVRIASHNGTSWTLAGNNIGNNPGEIEHISAGMLANGDVAISYYDSGPGELRLAVWDGATWFVELVDDGGSADVGRFNSLAVATEVTSRGLQNHVAIAYYDATNQSIKYAHNSAGTWFSQSVLPDVGNMIDKISLALDAAIWTKPVIAYTTAPGMALHLAYTDDPGRPWTVQFVSSGGVLPLRAVDLVYDGRARLLYRDQNGGLAYSFPTAGKIVPAPAHAAAGNGTGKILGFDGEPNCLGFSVDPFVTTFANPISQAVIGPTRSNSLDDGAVMRGLTGLFAQTEGGLQYTYLYFEHAAEMADIGFADPALLWDSYRTLHNFMPGLEALVSGRGDQVLVTQEMVDNALDIWQRFAAAASPALTATIHHELLRYNNLQDFVGMSFAEWASAIGVDGTVGDKQYLPIIIKP